MDRRGFLKVLAAIPAAMLVPLPAGIGAETNAVVGASWPVSAAGGFQVGDIFTISGVYQTNPMTLQSTGREKQFVVTATTDDGNIVSMHPQMYADGPYQNVTNLPTVESRIRPLWCGQTVPTSLYQLGCAVT